VNKLRVIAGAIVTGAALALLSPLSSAQAASSCTITPASVTLYSKAKNVTFDVPGATEWSLTVSDLFLAAGDDSEFSYTLIQMDPSMYRNKDAGKHAAAVYKDDSTCGTPFTLLRGTTLTAQAKNAGAGKRSIAGTLKRVNFGFDAESDYSGYAGQKVRIEVKAAKSTKWVSAGTVTTKKGGAFKLTKKIGKRQWRAVYAGSATAGARISAVSKA
jgi:hypothetical protein